MPPSDRAFRALGREEPDVLVSLLRATGLPIPGRLTPIDVSDPKLDAPAHPLEADFVAHTADGEVLHVECQGYRDASFEERLPRYHLALALRFWPRRVRTIAVWLSVPPVHQRRTMIPHGDIEVRVTDSPRRRGQRRRRARRLSRPRPTADDGAAQPATPR